MMKKRKIFLIGLLVFSAVLCMGFSGRTADVIEGKQPPVIIIGDDREFPPYSFIDANGEPSGFNVEIAKAAGKAMGYDVVIRLDDWDKTRKALEEGKIDAISGMFYSKEREKLYSFSPKHSITNGDIFTRSRISIRSLEDLRGKTVVTQKSDIMDEFLSNKELGIHVVEVPTVADALKLVKDGTYDYAGVLKLPGLYCIKQYELNGVKAQGLMITPNDYCMAVKKGNEDLLLSLDSGLQIIKANGEYQRIYDKWLGVYEGYDPFSLIVKYKWIFIAVSLLFVGLIFISMILNRMVYKRTKELETANHILNQSNREVLAQRDYINYLAFHDPLTNLPNRRKFSEELDEAIQTGRGGAVILLDLDNFKAINDTMGHVYGDKVLREVARRLETVVQENVFVSRFGGDEFLILIEAEDRLEKIRSFVEKVNHIFDEKLIMDGTEIEIRFSMGVTIYPKDSNDVETLIMNADLALYEVKGRGKNTYGFFSSELTDRILRRSNVESLLREAIDTDGFYLLYQPQVELTTGEAKTYEALLRIKGSSISPGEFIPIAEEIGLIIKIGRIVTEKVIEQLDIWRKEGLSIRPVSINFSAAQLQDKGFIGFIEGELKKRNIDPHLIEIEITENIFLNNKDQTIQFLNQLRQLGMRISIDDFGTGYSSLSYLTFLPIDRIKLDRSLNNKFLEMENIKVMDSLIQLAHSLELEVVAEGIESYEQYRRLKVGKCDFIQGYYFSKPLEPKNIRESFRTNYLELKDL